MAISILFVCVCVFFGCRFFFFNFKLNFYETKTKEKLTDQENGPIAIVKAAIDSNIQDDENTGSGNWKGER